MLMCLYTKDGTKTDDVTTIIIFVCVYSSINCKIDISCCKTSCFINDHT